MLLYTLEYHDAKTGRRLPDMDFDLPLPERSAAGELIVARCTNGDPRDVRYIGSQGEVMPPAWVYTQPGWLVSAIADAVRAAAVQPTGCVVVGASVGSAHPSDVAALRRELGGCWYSEGSRPAVGRDSVKVFLSRGLLGSDERLREAVERALVERERGLEALEISEARRERLAAAEV